MPEDHDVKIAVMQSQIESLREQQRLHKEEITKTLNHLADRVFESINGIRDDIKDIYEFINRSRGSFTTLLLFASAIGGFVFALFSWWLERFK